jgi:aminoglycoside N3'-acetyltransferase
MKLSLVIFAGSIIISLTGCAYTVDEGYTERTVHGTTTITRYDFREQQQRARLLAMAHAKARGANDREAEEIGARAGNNEGTRAFENLRRNQ